MEIKGSLVKQLRDQTGAGIMDCKWALTQAQGNMEKALELLTEKGLKNAEKKAGRVVNHGGIFSYVHGEGRIGVLVEVNCETDFVARTERFQAFAKDIAMHIAAFAPKFISNESKLHEVPDEEVLMNQPFLKNPAKTVRQYLGDSIGVMGENLVVQRFVRYALGEETSSAAS